jgi:hypothetical protein
MLCGNFFQVLILIYEKKICVLIIPRSCVEDGGRRFCQVAALGMRARIRAMWCLNAWFVWFMGRKVVARRFLMRGAFVL